MLDNKSAREWAVFCPFDSYELINKFSFKKRFIWFMYHRRRSMFLVGAFWKPG